MFNLKNFLLSLVLLLSFLVILIIKGSDSDVCTQRASEQLSSKIDSGKDGIFLRIVNLIIYLTASLSILMVVIGAFKYVISGGEGSQTKSAKDTILYALVGLFVAISSFAIVRFAISRI